MLCSPSPCSSGEGFEDMKNLPHLTEALSHVLKQLLSDIYPIIHGGFISFLRALSVIRLQASMALSNEFPRTMHRSVCFIAIFEGRLSSV